MAVRSRQRGQKICSGSIVAKCFADVSKPVDIARTEYKSPAQLEWVLARSVLAMPGSFGPASCDGIFAPQQVKQVRGLQSSCSIGLAPLINHQRKRDAGFLAKSFGVLAVSKPDCRQCCAPIAKGAFMFAQLRHMFPTEYSAVVAEENKHDRLIQPKRTEADFMSICIRKNNRG